MEQLTGTMSSVPNSNNYENMSHKPQINGVELTGNKTSEELGLGGGEVTRQELEDALRNKVDTEDGKVFPVMILETVKNPSWRGLRKVHRRMCRYHQR